MPSTSEVLIESGTLREDILKIVTDLIENRRFVNVEELFRRTRKETGAERLAIENVIDRLIKEKAIVPGSRITRQIILHNPTRHKIFEFIKQFPGVNVFTVKKALNLGSNSALWHIGVLVQFGCLQEVVYKTSSIYALPRLSPQEVLFQFVMRKAFVRSIFSAIERKPSTLAELTHVMGEDKAKIAYHLNILQELSFIERVTAGEDKNVIAYNITPSIIARKLPR